MEGQKRSLFEDSKPEPQVVGSVDQERMFISGDLSSYNLPENFLKEKKEMPDFIKGFLFTFFCGFLVLILAIIVGISIESGDHEDYEEIVFISDGVEKNYSYQLNNVDDYDKCWNVDLWVDSPDLSIDVRCWSASAFDDDKKSGKIFPIHMYQFDIEIGVLDFNATEVNMNLPHEIENNSNVTFRFEHYSEVKELWVIEETIFVIEKNNSMGDNIQLDTETSTDLYSEITTNTIIKNKTSDFLVPLPLNYGNTNYLDLELSIINSENEEMIKNQRVGKQSDCWYYGSKCTFTVGKDTEIGFIDFSSKILVISLEKPLPSGTTLEIYYDYDDGDSEELMILFLWLPPILFVGGVIMMIYNKNGKMLGGAFAALLPAIIVTFILTLIIFETFL
ncbi:MAG: hypothetical protein VYE59_02695 [Candidatus Thermoplasmatota archaeon]|nr:hypothetical protein [Candidatus Thermoplasmatota archaeon]